ncbi:MAG: hypothetical protein DRP87_03760 [Spirochaetes bacterium]|nr:MAG: hypothetical protein DRP87_03760 [Spirochaetota bacterium]
MALEEQKSTAFIVRLLKNPALHGFTPLQKEEHILQFLSQNSSQLYPTLSSSNFFPNKNWDQIWSLLTKTLFTEINKEMLPALKSIIEEKLDFTFVSFLRQQNYPFTKLKEELYNFISALLEKPELRRAYTGPLTALWVDFTEKYIDQVFVRREYIHFELTKVQRLKMSREEIKNMIDASILLRPAVFILSAIESAGAVESVSGLVQPHFVDKVFKVLKKKLPFLPDELLRSSLNSNVSFIENRFLEATARLTAIFTGRCRTFNPHTKTDRGADTPDKSWFSIARRNYRFYGYDIKILDELYKISAENDW